MWRFKLAYNEGICNWKDNSGFVMGTSWTLQLPTGGRQNGWGDWWGLFKAASWQSTLK